MEPITVRVALPDRAYDVVITAGDRAGLGPFAQPWAAAQQVLIVADTNTATYAEGVSSALRAIGASPSTLVVPAGERQKSLGGAAAIYDRLADLAADRQTLVTAVGGGVIGDLAGFVAATYARGLPLLMVPTTLLAMVDSAIGGKVGLNHAQGKNLIGAIHQPVGVWADVACLVTLPAREYSNGLAEVVKYGVALDQDFFIELERQSDALANHDPEVIAEVIARCCRLKAAIVERDERDETGVRAVLNFGHTFGHAFETISDYTGWRHGEAVAAGMMCAARLARERRLVGRDFVTRLSGLLERFALPTAPPPVSAERVLEVMRRDKKTRARGLRLVLPVSLGKAQLADDVSEDEVRFALQASGASEKHDGR